MNENIEPDNNQPPEFVDPNTVVPDGTPTYVAPAQDSRAAEVGEKTGAQENWINPNQVNTMGTNAVRMGGKAWVWWTVAGVVTTLVILLAGTYYFYKVKGSNTTNKATTENPAVTKADSGISTSWSVWPDSGESVIVVIAVKNNTQRVLDDVKVDVTATDVNGTRTTENISIGPDTLPPGKTGIVEVPYDSNPTNVKIVAKTQSNDENYYADWMVSDTGWPTTPGGMLQATIKNTGNKTLGAVRVGMVFFDNKGQAAGYTTGASNKTSIAPGESAEVTLYPTLPDGYKYGSHEFTVSGLSL